jgi:hypothetical protein
MARYAYTPDSAMDEFPDDDRREWLCPGPCTPCPRNPLSPLRRAFFLRSKSWEPRKQAEIENAIAAYEKRAEEARHDLAARVRFR